MPASFGEHNVSAMNNWGAERKRPQLLRRVGDPLCSFTDLVLRIRPAHADAETSVQEAIQDGCNFGDALFVLPDDFFPDGRWDYDVAVKLGKKCRPSSARPR